MKLDIIVPHYKEPWSICQYLFESIAMQRNVPWDEVGVIVVNDGDDPTLDGRDWSVYPYNVRYLKKEHGGVSAARNYGVDHSDADYVMFCDIDDGFLNNYGLHMVLSAMDEDVDYVIGAFAEESLLPDKKTITLVAHQHDLTFMHGKLYKRSFLTEYNLRFDEAMTAHEDGYFNMLVFITAKMEGRSIRKIETPFYLWCWNPNSVVRTVREDFTLRTYDKLMLTRTGLCRELKRRGYQEEYERAVVMTVLNSYYDFQKPRYYLSQNQKYLKMAEKAFKGFYEEFYKVFLNQTNDYVAKTAKTARETATMNGMLMEREDLKSFLKRINYEVKRQ